MNTDEIIEWDNEELINLFDDIIEQSGSYDIAEAEFRLRLSDDPRLKAAYKAWCREVGSTEKNGFSDYCDEHLEAQDDIWETLRDDYDE